MSRARDLAKLANPSIFSVGTNNNVGINSETPDTKLDVIGVVSATSFSGDGSQLTGIIAGATLSPSNGTQRLVVTSQTTGSMTEVGTNSDITYDTGTATISATQFSGTLLGNATGLQGTPSITVQDITAETVSIAGTISYEDVSNVNSVGIITANKGIVVPAYGVVVTGVVTATSFVGAVTGTAGGLSGTPNISVGTIDASGVSLFSGGLTEKYENAETTLGAQPNNPLSDGNVILFTGNESGNLTINFTGVHATLSNGETVSFTAILTPNNSGKITVAQVDGQAITIKWSGGSAPSAGASGQDIYTFQILKTGTGVSDYTVFGAATNYA